MICVNEISEKKGTTVKERGGERFLSFPVFILDTGKQVLLQIMMTQMKTHCINMFWENPSE